MDRAGISHFSGTDNRRDIKITLCGWSRAYADTLIGQQDVFQVPVGLGMHGHGCNAQFMAGAQDTQGNLAPVGDYDLL